MEIAFEFPDDVLAERVRQLIREELAAEQLADDRFLNAASAADFLDISEDALRSRVRRREIPFRKRDGRLYFDRAELRAYVEGRV